MSPSQTLTPTSPLDAHLPLDRRQALARRQALPEHGWGTALFADISGFTPLMERLADTLGPQQGAEALTLLLNALFASLIAEIHRYGGSIIAFGGDALTCWFPDPSPLHKVERGGERGPRGEGSRAACFHAAACAYAMLRQVEGFSAETPAGAVTLAMRIGVATGAVRRLVVGRPPYGLLDVLAGATVDRVAEAQHRARTGQAVGDAATAAVLAASAPHPLGEGFFLLDAFAAATPGPPPAAPVLTTRQVRPWLAEPLYRRLRVGHGALAAELRLVNSIFVNLSGLDYDADPAAGSKLHQYVVRAQERLAPFEGHLAAVTCGDKGTVLYVLLGAPISHEDDPARAVGFALALQEAVQELPFITAQRIGISLGRAYAGILGSAERCTYSVLGDAVNTSARLMQAARPGQILVSRPVQKAAAGRYAFRPLGTIALKGKEEAVPIFEPLAVQGGRPAAVAEEVLIGRSAEKQAIAALLVRVAAGQGGVLLVEGEAGVGKSALVRHLLQQARAAGWPAHVGSCLSYGRHIPYLPWRLILEETHRLDPAWGPAERAAHLETVVAGLPDPAGRPGYWHARFPLLAAAMGLEVPDTLLTRSLEGELRRDNTFQLLEALVRAPAAAGPAVVVLEDAYWADELSLQLAAHIARGLGDLPLLLVRVQRPPEREPAAADAWQDLPHLLRISLAPLEDASALELACRRLDAAALPPELKALLQEKTQGNPFFIEELVRALQEGACLQRAGDTVQLCGGWQDLQLPDTIEGVVQARLDRLPEEDHLTLKVSSVIGRTFERRLLREVRPGRLSEAALARQLDRLEEAAVVVPEEPAPQWRYAFQHPILHEVAYGTLLFAQRRQLHGQIGGVLEEWYAEDLPRVLDLLAYHYSRSEEREKAVRYLQRAAEKARREYANDVALGYYSQALDRLLPREDEPRYHLLAGRERILDLLGEREAQERDLDEMGLLAAALNDTRRQVEVLNRQARRAADTGQFEEARRLAIQSWHTAEERGDLAGAAEAQKNLGILHGSVGEYPAALQFFTQAQFLYQQLEDRLGEALCVGNLATVTLYQGDAERALSYYAQALALCRALEDRLKETIALVNLGLAEFYRGDYERSLDYYRQALTLARETGNAHEEEVSLGNSGDLALALGDLTAAAAYNEEALELARRLRDREGEATNLTSLGLVASYQGAEEQAREYLQAALESYRAMGHRRGEATVLHARGVVEIWAGENRAAQEYLRPAAEIRQEIGEGSNALATQSWLGLAHASAGEQDAASALLEHVLAQLAAEGYGGDYPEKELLWAAFRVVRPRDPERARDCLERAYHQVQQEAGRIHDPHLRQSFLENVPVNREIVQDWLALSRKQIWFA